MITLVEAERLGLTRVGLPGTRFTMQGSAYPQAFTRRGITMVPPDAADLEYVHEKYMGELVPGVFLPETGRACLRWSIECEPGMGSTA